MTISSLSNQPIGPIKPKQYASKSADKPIPVGLQSLGADLVKSLEVIPFPNPESKALHARSIKEVEFSKLRATLSRPVLALVEKGLKQVASSESLDQKIRVLTELIDRTPDKKLAWPYVLERARHHLLYGDSDHGFKAINDLLSVTGCLSPEYYFLLSEAYLATNDWLRAYVEHENALKMLGGERDQAIKRLPKAAENIEQIFRPFSEHRRSTPKFNARWLRTPHEGCILIMRLYQMGAEQQMPIKELMQKMHSIVENIHFMNGLIGNPAGSEWVVDMEEFFLATELSRKEFEALMDSITQCATNMYEQEDCHEFVHTALDAFRKISLMKDQAAVFNVAAQVITTLQRVILQHSSKVGRRIGKAMVTILSNLTSEKAGNETRTQLEAVEGLVARYPLLLPRFLLLLKDNPSFLPILADFEKKIGGSAFERLVNTYAVSEHPSIKGFGEGVFDHYVVEDDDGTRKLYGVKPDLIDQLQKNGKQCKQAAAVLKLEQEIDNPLLPMFLADKSRFEGHVVDSLEKNKLFAQQVDATLWKSPENYKLLRNRLVQDKLKVYQLFDLAADYPIALVSFIKDKGFLCRDILIHLCRLISARVKAES